MTHLNTFVKRLLILTMAIAAQVATGQTAEELQARRLEQALGFKPSHQIPPPVDPAVLRTVPGKLAAAKAYADWFLAEDAELVRAFGIRDPHITRKGQPAHDCGVRAIVQDISSQSPYFESKARSVVIVPVVVDLIILDVTGDENDPPEKELKKGGIGCTFEYEAYAPQKGEFEAIPNFRKQSLTKSLMTLGEVRITKKNWHYMIAPPAGKSLFRFNFRIDVGHDTPYQLEPQFPRHYRRESAEIFINKVIRDRELDIKERRSDRDPTAQGEALNDDLIRMRRQQSDAEWELDKIRTHEASIQK